MSKQRKTDWTLDLSKKLNVAHINLCTEAEGPYRRMAIWFQGCNILCEGCCNPELQPIKVAYIMSVQQIIDVALESKEKNGIEGVTFLGGEPTLQENLTILANALGKIGLGIILFTGKTFVTLSEPLVASIDLIVDGKFDGSRIDYERNLIGSQNQKMYFVTDRYKKNISWFLDTREKKVEINLRNDNLSLVTGDVI